MKQNAIRRIASLLCLCLLVCPNGFAEELPTLEVLVPDVPAEELPVLDEEAVETELQGLMVEYSSLEAGYSVQYPALFTEDRVSFGAEDISGSLPDGSSFSAARVPREGRTLEAYLEARGQGFTWSAENRNITGTVQKLGADGNGFAVLLAVAEGESDFYEVTLRWPAADEEAFRLYAEYMTNSLMVDELGIG